MKITSTLSPTPQIHVLKKKIFLRRRKNVNHFSLIIRAPGGVDFLKTMMPKIIVLLSLSAHLTS
jgi:hypothetical protein